MADIVPSEELRAFLLRFYAVWGAQDFEALREMFATGAHVLAIGTDPNEWWTGRDGVEVMVRQTSEMGGFSFRPTAPTVYCIGNVGWVADQPHLKLGTGVEFQVRLTLVAVIERGHWRIVQWHASFGQSNEASIGLSLTTSIDKIERSVRDDRPAVGIPQDEDDVPLFDAGARGSIHFRESNSAAVEHIARRKIRLLARDRTTSITPRVMFVVIGQPLRFAAETRAAKTDRCYAGRGDAV